MDHFMYCLELVGIVFVGFELVDEFDLAIQQ